VRYLKQVTIDKRIETRVYQAQMLHKEFAQPLNVVVILKTHLATGRTAHVLLFSSDLTLAYDKLIDSYSLRFQLEFNFRDAKQFWGLEDFMNVKPTAVTNAANLALFMVNISHKLLQSFRKACPDFSVIDLKAYCRGLRYIDEVTQCLPQIPETIVLDNIKQHVASLGAIHHIQTQPSPS
jgi:putative transposase